MKKVILILLGSFIVFNSRGQYSSNTCGSTMLISDGILAVSGDDNTATYSLPFDFSFYGVTYNSITISTNGFISFDETSGNGCCSGYDLPNTSTTYIGLAHSDLYVPSSTPGTDGSVYYETIGTAPNRVFVIHYQSAYQCCDADPVLTGEIQLYETTNEIRLVTESVNATGSTTMGIAKGDGSEATIIDGRNSVPFSAGIECWSLNSLSVLPITLISINGHSEGGKNILQWKTASEYNSSSYQVERSINGFEYATVQNIAAAGSSTTEKDYSFADILTEARRPMYYYRLKMIDMNGAYKYSPVVRISSGDQPFLVSSYPNPFTKVMTISIESPAQDIATISFTDMQGNIVATQKNTIVKGSNSIECRVTDKMISGTYLLSVSTSKDQRVLKVIKR